MSKMEHRDTQQRVVIAVYRISCCKRGRELLLEEGAPEALIRLISKPNEEMRKVRIYFVVKVAAACFHGSGCDTGRGYK